MFILLLLLTGLFIWWQISTDAHHVMQEARDIRTALRLVGLEYRGLGSSVYDQGAQDGLAEGAAQKLRDLTYAEGEVDLLAWDESSGMPLSFTYRKGAYVVEYKAQDRDHTISGKWEIYYAFHILTYTTERD